MTELTNDTPNLARIDVEQVACACRQALIRVGTPADIADRVVGCLVTNEVAGLPSHGILRLPDYVQDAGAGMLKVDARPTVTAPSTQVRVVDGERGFGVLAADAVATNLCELLAAHPMCAVALTNAGHIGRLADIGRAVAVQGGIVLGFVNYLGAGQRVAPWHGQDGRLCTNPLLVAIPAHPRPFVLDMSTSAVSEGKVRQRWLAGQPVPAGWLVDAGGAEVNEPGRLYADPPTAFITPLGGAQAYKGFGLAVAVELLAGVVTGAGFAQPGVDQRGNGGLFIGLAPMLAGRAYDDVLRDIDLLRAHVLTSGPSVRWPGDSVASPPDTGTVAISRRVWAEILDLASGEVGL